VLYPQGGLHAASSEHNVRKHPQWLQPFASLLKAIDPAHHSFQMLERRQYLSEPRPLIVVNSEMVRGHFGQYYGVESEDIRVVRAAVDPARFCEEDRPRRRIEWRERWGLRPDETVAALIAMNYRLKGLTPLLHALRHVPANRPFRLLVAGSPRYHGYEALARRLGVADRVRFVGYCPETRNAYFASDFLVHPTFYDPCSLVVLEALACGLPIITSQYNGASELLTPREGFVIDDPHDDRQLGWCLTQLLDAGRRQACAAAARRAAAQWTFDHHYRQMLRVFAEGAARRAAA
jgi:UDP-glucose:(heptosyl)LPS alpha-1,3-glucosyltransferase